MATMEERWQQLNMLFDDPIADVEPKEALKLIYHAMRFEFLEFRIDRLIRRQRKHGVVIQDALDVANFKHQMNDL
jgi:hypothetical protein